MAKSFRDRYGPWALVAGASEGIGAQFATELARRGIDLLCVARREEPLAALGRRLRAAFPIEVRLLSLDLGDNAQLERLRREAAAVDIGLLVYNAASSPIGHFLERSQADHEAVLRVNCRAPALLALEIGRHMRDRGRGGIIFMSSIAGLQGTAMVAHYAATKAYLRTLAEGLWQELRPHGVDTLACLAGATNTPGYRASAPAQVRFNLPPVLSPEEVVATALGALGKSPTCIPGHTNRLAYFLLHRALPRRLASRIVSQRTEAMYRRSGRS